MDEKLNRIETCEFRRTARSNFEKGILLNEGTLGLLDIYGKKVEECYAYRSSSGFVYENNNW